MILGSRNLASPIWLFPALQSKSRKIAIVQSPRQTRPTLQHFERPPVVPARLKTLRRGWGSYFLLALMFLPAAAGIAPAAETDADSEASYDPWAGLDRNGRIPAAEMPADIPNPDRWRYIPEARIKEGNLFQRFLVTSFMAPFVFHESDVGTGFGVALADSDFRLQRRREFLGVFASYTTEGQQSYVLIWDRWMHQRDLPAGGILFEDRSFWRSRVSYGKTLTRRFFGLGPNSKESDEASYTDELIRLEIGFERAVPEPGSNWVVGLGLATELHELSEGRVKKDGNRLQVEDLDPELWDEAEHRDLGRIQISTRWDTRDSPINPYRGWVVGADVDAAVLQSGGNVGALYRLYGGWVHTVPGLFHSGGSSGEENPPTDTVALGIRLELTSGDLPFFALPTLGGGHDMRGFIEGRFRDAASWIGRAEYRFWFIPRGFPLLIRESLRVERVGAAIFYDVGAVAKNGTRLFHVKLRHSFGVGLLFTLERTAPFRIDLGFSEEGYQLTAGFGFSF